MTQQVRAIFLSDIHLGTRGCQADRLLDFLRSYESEYLFLVGDIIDFWSMSRAICWTEQQNTVVQKVLRCARHGEHVMLVPGNHDEALREYDGISFGNVQVVNEHVHVAADGKRYLLIHGDEFDQVTRHHRWVAVLGDVAYNWLVRINALLSWARRRHPRVRRRHLHQLRRLGRQLHRHRRAHGWSYGTAASKRPGESCRGRVGADCGSHKQLQE